MSQPGPQLGGPPHPWVWERVSGVLLCSQPLLIMQRLQIYGLRGQAGDVHKGKWRAGLGPWGPPAPLWDRVLVGKDGHLDFSLKSEEEHW